MNILFLIISVYSKMIVKVQPDNPVLIDFPLTEEFSDFSLSLLNLNPSVEIKYKMIKDSLDVDHDLNTFSLLERDFYKKYTEQGLYTLILHNNGKEDCLVSLQSSTNKVLGNEDNDVKALKTLFSEIEVRLSRLYDLYLRLKTIQEKNIHEASNIVKGLYIMLVIPIVYILVGFGKIKAVKMMFAPKRGIKP